MDQANQLLDPLLRWLHIAAGILWIGLLYFFNLVNGPFAAKLDGETKKKVVPELMPRALYWFRWGAAFTWISGILLLMIVFYHQKNLFNADPQWTPPVIALGVFILVAPFIYDVLLKAITKNEVMGAVGVAMVALYTFLCVKSGFGYRGYVIHVGAMFGTIMAFNVWFRIWPAQRQIITAVKAGQAPDAKLVALAGARSKHNVYMSVPLVWTMINSHTVLYSRSWLILIAVILISWLVVNGLYKKAAKVQGF